MKPFENATVSQMRSDFYAFRVKECVDELMDTEDVFQEKLDRSKVILQFTEQMETLPLEEFLTIDDHAFRQQAGKFMAMQLIPTLQNTEKRCGEEKN